MSFETAVVAIIGVAAAVLVVRHLIAEFRGEGNCPGCAKHAPQPSVDPSKDAR